MSERERIAQALVDLSVERGFRNLGVTEVCQRAGLPSTAFDRHFDDLEDCFAQIYEAQRNEFVVAVVDGFNSARTWCDQMRGAAWAMLEFLREDRYRAYFMSCEVHGGGERARLIRDEAMQAFFALIDLGRSELTDPDALTPFTAETIGSAIYQQFQAAIARFDFAGLEALVPHMMYAAILPYLGPEAAAEELKIAPPPSPPDSAASTRVAG